MIVAGLGDLPVFPCNTRKQPLVKGGYKAARRIEPPKHWPLTAVPTGSVSGFDCVDVDPEGLEWLAANPLPATRAHRTRRGGWHFLFRAVDGLTGSADTRIEKGVHVRASGNYIVWWPLAGFEVQDAPLREWPEDLLRLAKVKRKASRVGFGEETPMLGGCDPFGVGMRVSPSSREARYSAAALRNAFDDLANKSARGSRNDTLNKLAFKLGAFWRTNGSTAGSL
jgi:Bifunctional DNA primase/polymerase, N-terminal